MSWKNNTMPNRTTTNLSTEHINRRNGGPGCKAWHALMDNASNHLLAARLHKLQRYQIYYWKQLPLQEQQQDVTLTTPSNDPQEEEEEDVNQ